MVHFHFASEGRLQPVDDAWISLPIDERLVFFIAIPVYG